MTWLSRNLTKLGIGDWMTENFPAVNSSDNDHMADVIGNKTDVAAETTDQASLTAILRKLLTTATRSVERITSYLPQGAPGQTAYFTVTGRVILLNIVGEVTVDIEGVAVGIKLISNPTVGNDVDLCAVLVIMGSPAGTLCNITGTLTDAMICTISGAMISQADSIIVSAGTIDLHTDINATGKIKWTLHYIPLDSGSSVVATY
ncbi:hypothetical protein ES703_62322 [subsurface metagenome]